MVKKRRGARRGKSRTITLRLGEGEARPVLPRAIGATAERRRQEGGTIRGERMIQMPDERRPRLVDGEWAVSTTPIELMTLHLGWWSARDAELFRRAAREFSKLAAQAGVRRPRVTPNLGLSRNGVRMMTEEEEEEEHLAGAELGRIARALPPGAYGLLFALVVLQDLPAPLRENRDSTTAHHHRIAERCEQRIAGLRIAGTAPPLVLSFLEAERDHHLARHAAAPAPALLREVVTGALHALVEVMGVRLPPGWTAEGR